MSYRIKLGKALKMRREELGLSQKSLSSLANKSEHYIRSVELGEDVPIDCYIDYIRAVKYPLDIKRDFGIDSKQSVKLEADRRKLIKYTDSVKELINSDFFSISREVNEIKAKLENDLDGVITSGNLSNVLKRLVSSQELKVDTSGKKHKYFK